MLKRFSILALVFSALSLASEPPVLLVQSVPDELRAQGTLEKAVEKETRRNVSEVTAIYRGLGPEISMVRRNPPAGWPAALRADFDQARDACEQRFGNPTPGREGRAALIANTGCTSKMQTGLWTRYLRQLKADTVILARVEAQRSGGFSVAISQVQVDENSKRTVTGSADRAKLSAVMSTLVAELLAGKGTSGSAGLDPELPVGPSSGVMAVSNAESALPPVRIACASGIPAELKLDSDSALAVTIAARWKTSVQAAGIQADPAVSCRLEATQEKESSPLMGQMEVLQAVLVCGQKQHRAMAALGPMLKGRTAADVISARLLSDAFDSYCGK